MVAASRLSASMAVAAVRNSRAGGTGKAGKVMFCFAFLAGAIAETSHPLHIAAPHGQSKQKFKPL